MGLLEQASLVITPTAVKAGKLYAIKPNDGTGDLDVVRATSATRVDENGLIEIPRTNLLLRSEEFDNASWNKLNVTVIGNVTTAPNGTLTADKIIATATNANHIVYNSLSSFVSSQSYNFSYYAKSAEYTKIAIRIGGAGYSIVNRAEINLSNGTIIYQQGFTSLQVQAVGNGWYRIQGTFIPASDIVANIQPLSDSYSVVADNYRFLGDDTSGIFVWGAQLEVGNVATEYIPTTSVIRTRFAGITQDGGSASNIPRLDYSSGSCPSILVEPQRTNLVFPSDIATTQVRAVTAQIYTLSFYGSGSVVLSGAYSGTLNGTATNNRVSLTFTPTAGNLTLTVSGTVTNWQLEAGSNATSVIKTVLGSVTRNTDVITKSNVFSENIITSNGGTLFLNLSKNDLLVRQAAQGIFLNQLINNTGHGLHIVNLQSAPSSARLGVRKIDINGNIGIYTTTASELKLLLKWNGSILDVFQNGVKVVSNSSFLVTNMQFLSFQALDVVKNINSCTLFPTALTDEQCIYLTTL